MWEKIGVAVFYQAVGAQGPQAVAENAENAAERVFPIPKDAERKGRHP
jgi:hypothetical protein